METNCTFCQIANGQKPADFLYRDDRLIVFRDAHPHSPVHLLVVPVKHIRSINDLAEEDRPLLSEMIYRAKAVAQELSIARSGYKLLFNVERGAGQLIFHLHMHLMGGW